MREIKPEIINDKEDQRDLMVLHGIAYHQGLVKANRFLLLLVACLMVVVLVLGFLLMPSNSLLDTMIKNDSSYNPVVYSVSPPSMWTEEVKNLKGQFVGVISGSIESKLTMLENSIRAGSINASLGAVQDLRNDLEVLKGFSGSEVNRQFENSKPNDHVLKEVSQLRTLLYMILISCGLMFTAVCGFWIRGKVRITHTKHLQTVRQNKRN